MGLKYSGYSTVEHKIQYYMWRYSWYVTMSGEGEDGAHYKQKLFQKFTMQLAFIIMISTSAELLSCCTWTNYMWLYSNSCLMSLVQTWLVFAKAFSETSEFYKKSLEGITARSLQVECLAFLNRWFSVCWRHLPPKQWIPIDFLTVWAMVNCGFYNAMECDSAIHNISVLYNRQ